MCTCVTVVVKSQCILLVQGGPCDAGTPNTDKDIYWYPGSKEEEIYAQMSHRKYHDIPRDKVKMLTKLGERAVW